MTTTATPNADRYTEAVRMALVEARLEQLAAAIHHDHDPDDDDDCPQLYIDGVPWSTVVQHDAAIDRAMALAYAHVYPGRDGAPPPAGWLPS